VLDVIWQGCGGEGAERGRRATHFDASTLSGASRQAALLGDF